MWRWQIQFAGLNLVLQAIDERVRITNSQLDKEIFLRSTIQEQLRNTETSNKQLTEELESTQAKLIESSAQVCDLSRNLASRQQCSTGKAAMGMLISTFPRYSAEPSEDARTHVLEIREVMPFEGFYL